MREISKKILERKYLGKWIYVGPKGNFIGLLEKIPNRLIVKIYEDTSPQHDVTLMSDIEQRKVYNIKVGGIVHVPCNWTRMTYRIVD